MPKDFNMPTPVAASGWNVTFNGLPAPRVRTRKHEETKPVYLDAAGNPTFEKTKTRAQRQKFTEIDGERVPLYLDPVTNEETPNRFHKNEAGLNVKNALAVETYSDVHRWEEQVLDADGNPRVEYATMSGNIQAMDANRQGLPVNPELGYDDLTEEERDALQDVLTNALGRKLAALGIQYPSVKAAEEAGAFNS